MIYRLQDKDKVQFVHNLLKDGSFGDSIVRAETFYLEDNGFITDINDEIFPVLKTLLWNKSVRQGFYTRYYAYGIVNDDEYKLIQFGRSIYSKIVEDPDNWFHTFHVRSEDVKNLPYGIKSFDNSRFKGKHNKTFAKEFLATKTLYMEDYFNKMDWKQKNKELSAFLKSKDIDIKTISQYKNIIREDKLERILKYE